MNSLPQFFVESIGLGEPGDRALLSQEDKHHALRVLRLVAGDSVRIVHAPTKRAYRAELEFEGNEIFARVVEALSFSTSNDSCPGVHTLIFSLSKGERNEVVVEKAVELGVQRIILWQSSRSIVRLHSEKDVTQKKVKFEKVAQAAAKQSKQLSLPEIAVIRSATELEQIVLPFQGLRIQGSLANDAQPIWQIPYDSSPYAMLAIGPEGDFSPEEEAWFRRYNFHPVSLGENILKSDTAAIASIAMVVALYGKNAKPEESNPE